MSDVFQPAFWEDEYLRSLGTSGPTALDIVFAGAQSGNSMLPASVRFLVDWDWFNQSAIDWLNAWQDTVLRDINATTRAQTVDIISNWIKSGENFDLLRAKLAPLFGATRADVIASTEVTRMYAEGNMLAWESTGVVGAVRWRTAVDERVCPICGPLHNMTARINANGFTTELGGLGLNSPPAHPRCRCWLQPVVSEDLLRQRIRGILNG